MDRKYQLQASNSPAGGKKEEDTVFKVPSSARLLFQSALYLAVSSLSSRPAVPTTGGGDHPSVHLTCRGSSSVIDIHNSEKAPTPPGRLSEALQAVATLRRENDALKAEQEKLRRRHEEDLRALREENDALRRKVLEQTSSKAPLADPGLPDRILPGDWIQGEPLGEGAHGTVYVAMHTVTGVFFAVKELLSSPADDDELARQVEKEIEFLRQLVHPNIVKYLGMEKKEISNSSSSTLCIFQEYVAGGSMRRVLSRFGPFQEPVVAQFLDDVLSGLAYLHKCMVVHRDIKGDNILITLTGRAKLGDFGTAELWSDEQGSDGETVGIQGSSLWMAPEVLEGQKARVQSDIWSVGCVIIEMATGTAPWVHLHDLTPMQQLYALSHEKKPPAFPPSLSAEAHAFLSLCFQRDFRARPSCAELLKQPWLVSTIAAAKSRSSSGTTHLTAAPPSEGAIPKSPKSPSQVPKITGFSSLSHSPNSPPQKKPALRRVSYNEPSPIVDESVLRHLHEEDKQRRHSMYSSETYRSQMTQRNLSMASGLASNVGTSTATSAPAAATAVAANNTSTHPLTSARPSARYSISSRGDKSARSARKSSRVNSERGGGGNMRAQSPEGRESRPLAEAFKHGSFRSVGGSSEDSDGYIDISLPTLYLAVGWMSCVRKGRGIEFYSSLAMAGEGEEEEEEEGESYPLEPFTPMEIPAIVQTVNSLPTN